MDAVTAPRGRYRRPGGRSGRSGGRDEAEAERLLAAAERQDHGGPVAGRRGGRPVCTAAETGDTELASKVRLRRALDRLAAVGRPVHVHRGAGETAAPVVE